MSLLVFQRLRPPVCQEALLPSPFSLDDTDVLPPHRFAEEAALNRYFYKRATPPAAPSIHADGAPAAEDVHVDETDTMSLINYYYQAGIIERREFPTQDELNEISNDLMLDLEKDGDSPQFRQGHSLLLTLYKERGFPLPDLLRHIEPIKNLHVLRKQCHDAYELATASPSGPLLDSLADFCIEYSKQLSRWSYAARIGNYREISFINLIELSDDVVSLYNKLDYKSEKRIAFEKQLKEMTEAAYGPSTD